MSTERRLFKIISLLTIAAMMYVSIPPLPIKAETSPFAGGDGSADDPYQIATAEQLNEVRHYLDAHFILNDDIDLNVEPFNQGEGWEPIGTMSNPFKGVFDGDGHAISHLYINRPGSEYQGLFGYTNQAEIRDVRIVDANVTGGPQVGTLVGTLGGSFNSGSTILNSSASGIVKGTTNVGGLVGNGQYSLIERSYADVEVEGQNSNVGGLLGNNNVRNKISNSYATGDVKGGSSAGGLVGISGNEIINSYAIGKVTGSGDLGGLVGTNTSVIQRITGSYYDQSTTGQEDTGKGTGKTTAEMKQQLTFEGWDFTDIWAIDPSFNDGYPYLRWQKSNDGGEEPGDDNGGGSGGGNGGGSIGGSGGTTGNTGVIVLVNGKEEQAGTASTTNRDGRTVTTILVDENKLQERLETEQTGAVVTIPLGVDSDVVIGELNGQIVKLMESKGAVVEINTGKETYKIPAEQINIDAVSDQIGTSVELQDIKIQIEIAAPTADIVSIAEHAAESGSYTLVLPPVEFTVRAVYGETVVDISKFNAYVERTIAIPEGVDPSKITTGVVVEPDGTARHVPTKVTVINGQYAAVINSLTNSIYSVVWNPVEFGDMANHWAKAAVNDMGSRMVVQGTASGIFGPDREMTRAEFTTALVSGLGLKPDNGEAPFPDVKPSDWYSDAIHTAYEYKLIHGFEDGSFRPNDKITREQAMVIISKAIEMTGLKDKLNDQPAEAVLQPFNDAADLSSWAHGGVAEVVQSGIVTGRSEDKLAPKSTLTRAEAAVLIQRLLQNSDLI